MFNWKQFIIDHFMTYAGLIVQGNGDEGDGLSKTGVFYYALEKLGLMGEGESTYFCGAVQETELGPGHWTRSSKEPWHSQWTVSRDQLLDAWQAFGAIRKYDPQAKEMLKENWKWMKSNWFRASKDILGPHHWGVLIRANHKWFLYPLLWLCDIALFVNTIIMIKQQDAGRCLHNWYFILQAEDICPTLFGWLSKLIYKKWVNMAWHLCEYFNTGKPGWAPAPPMAELWCEFVEKNGWGKYKSQILWTYRWTEEFAKKYVGAVT